MNSGKYLSRKAYKRTLGLTYLISLILIALVFVLLPALFREGIKLEGENAVYIPLTPFYLAAAVTFLVWAFLRLAVPVRPLTEEERGRPLLQRLSYLQLFAWSGIILAVAWVVSAVAILPSVSDSILISGWNTVGMFAFHFLSAAFAAALLYAGARIGRIAITLLSFLLFIAAIIGNLTGTLALLDFILQTKIMQVSCSGGEYTATETCMETGDEEVSAWLDSAATSVVRYCHEYSRATSTDTTLCFADQLLIDFQNMQLKKPEEDYAAKEPQRWKNKKWINGHDCYYLYRLSSLILDRTSLTDEEVYEIMSERVLPVIMKGLYDDYLYPASPLEMLVDMLDYAYYDLQSLHDEKWASLYADMAAEKSLSVMAVLLPYFNRPYAMVHSGFDEVHMLWAYSFWARRWKDGHTALCRRLLDQVLEIYPNAVYTVDKMEKTEQFYRAKRFESDLTPEDILHEVTGAFADTPRPARQTILMSEMETDEQEERVEIYSRYTWQEIPTDVLYDHPDVLSYFTPEGFRYYLPAFLTATVQDYRPGERLYALLVHSLTYDPVSLTSGPEHFGPFSRKQSRAIRHFLEWLSASHYSDFTEADGESTPWQAIESWWLQFEEEE